MFEFKSKDIPSQLRNPKFILEPLLREHVALDYLAVMESKEKLRIWSNSNWPSDDFAEAENLADLERHENEHLEGKAFTYTILDPTRSECLGCVYFAPLNHTLSRLGVGKDELADIDHNAVEIRFWVRETELASSLEEQILIAVTNWVDRDWQFSKVVYCTNTHCRTQIDLFVTSGYSKCWDLPASSGDCRYLFYQP